MPLLHVIDVVKRIYHEARLVGNLYRLLTAKCIVLSLFIDHSTYYFQGRNPILPLSIQFGVRLIEVFNNRN